MCIVSNVQHASLSCCKKAPLLSIAFVVSLISFQREKIGHGKQPFRIRIRVNASNFNFFQNKIISFKGYFNVPKKFLVQLSVINIKDPFYVKPPVLLLEYSARYFF
jgi:hypothetical protein